MFWKWLRFIILLLITSTIYFVGEYGVPFLDEAIPPVGRLINPYTGFWQNNQQQDNLLQEVKHPNLKDGVTILWDKRRVPHIFAQNDYDTYFAQGFVTAQNRLWQMDFVSRVGSGRLSEVVGKKAIEFDRFNRRIGLLESAQKALDTLKTRPTEFLALEAYADGVNAWISQLSEKDYPVEFKLMNYKPESWSPLKSTIILKYMAWDLDGGNQDRFITNAKKVLPDSLFQQMYPLENPFTIPLSETDSQYRERKWKERVEKKQAERKKKRKERQKLYNQRVAKSTLKPAQKENKIIVSPQPHKPKTASQPATLPQEKQEPITQPQPTQKPKKDPTILQPPSSSMQYLPNQMVNVDYSYRKGSNNFAVNGSKSRSGAPILANDPHLNLSLPSLWFEVQLNNGNDLNVYGASLPGVPMVVIGFNDYSAWGLTYTTSDPIDFTHIQLNKQKSQYKIDGNWENPRVRQDTILVKNNQPIIDKTIITKFGPIIYTDSLPRQSFNAIIPGENIAMNWTAHQPSLEFVTINRLNRAKNLEDYKNAVPYFNSPGQNILFASKDNDIAIWHRGLFPNRSMEQARFVLDTAKLEKTWKEFIHHEDLPHIENPSRGYIESANQMPAIGQRDIYLGSDEYNTFVRSSRIANVLDSLELITPYDLQKLQTDNHSLLGERLVPFLLERIDRTKLSAEELDVYKELKNWNFQFIALSKSPIIFNTWISEIQKAIWQDEAKSNTEPWKMPRLDVTADVILNDTTSVYFDNKKTKIIESYHDIILQSFQSTVHQLTERYGSLNDQWRWGNTNPTTIKSIAQIKGFGTTEIATNGSKQSVNALSGSNGPSWRMVVELGNTPKAYGIYPGGQSGNPGSKHYNDFVNDWVEGEYYELKLLKNKHDDEQAIFKTQLIPYKQ